MLSQNQEDMLPLYIRILCRVNAEGHVIKLVVEIVDNTSIMIPKLNQGHISIEKLLEIHLFLLSI